MRLDRFGTILWVDDRNSKFEGQILTNENEKLYFNFSVWNSEIAPKREMIVCIELDDNRQIFLVKP